MIDNVYVTDEPLRDRLVRTGTDLLEREGLSALTLRAVTRETGVSHGAPRRYFPTHNALLAAIALGGIEDLSGRLGPIEGSGTERLVELGVIYVEFATERPAMFELMFRHDLLEGSGANLRSITVPIFQSFIELVLSNGADRAAAVGLWTNIHGIAVSAANTSLWMLVDRDDLESLVTQAVRAYTR